MDDKRINQVDHRVERNLKELIDGLSGITLIGEESQQITALTYDSRKVVPGSLFIAIPGYKDNGFFYIEEAIARGAVAIMVCQPYDVQDRVAVLQVNDIRLAMSHIARRFYRMPDEMLHMTGITGTNGKTTVATLSQFLLNEASNSVGLLGTIHYDLGGKYTFPSSKTTPESLDLHAMLEQMLQRKCRHVIMEVSSHGIALKRVHFVTFDLVVFLNLTQDHLDFHGDLETYFQEKVKLFNGSLGPLPKVAIINTDDPYGRRLIQYIPHSVKIITFGNSSSATIRSSNITLSPQGLSFNLHWPEGEIFVTSSLLGSYNISNILASLAIGWISGKNMESLVLKLKNFQGVRGRMEKVDMGQDFSVLVDYAHTADALLNVLKILKQITKGRLLLVFGCGGDRDKGKRLLMTKVAQEWSDFAWATSDNPRNENLESIFKDMHQGVTLPEKIVFISERRRAIEKALEAAREGDCILIAGKGHETYQDIGNRIIPFDDAQVARELLIFKNKINVLV